jgi:hypothetical protein
MLLPQLHGSCVTPQVHLSNSQVLAQVVSPNANNIASAALAAADALWPPSPPPRSLPPHALGASTSSALLPPGVSLPLPYAMQSGPLDGMGRAVGTSAPMVLSSEPPPQSQLPSSSAPPRTQQHEQPISGHPPLPHAPPGFAPAAFDAASDGPFAHYPPTLAFDEHSPFGVLPPPPTAADDQQLQLHQQLLYHHQQQHHQQQPSPPPPPPSQQQPPPPRPPPEQQQQAVAQQQQPAAAQRQQQTAQQAVQQAPADALADAPADTHHEVEMLRRSADELESAVIELKALLPSLLPPISTAQPEV